LKLTASTVSSKGRPSSSKTTGHDRHQPDRCNTRPHSATPHMTWTRTELPQSCLFIDVSFENSDISCIGTFSILTRPKPQQSEQSQSSHGANEGQPRQRAFRSKGLGVLDRQEQSDAASYSTLMPTLMQHQSPGQISHRSVEESIAPRMRRRFQHNPSHQIRILIL